MAEKVETKKNKKINKMSSSELKTILTKLKGDDSRYKKEVEKQLAYLISIGR